MSTVRYVVVVVVSVSLVFIAFGWKAVEWAWLSQDSYRFWSTILGSSASILALLSFIKPPLSKSDLKTAHLDDLKLIADTANRLEQLSAKKTETESEVQRLERQRDELRLLVQKASLVLYVQDKRQVLEGEILSEIGANSGLASKVAEYRQVISQLHALGEEVQANEDLREIVSIIKRADRSDGPLTSISLLEFMGRSLGKALANVLR